MPHRDTFAIASSAGVANGSTVHSLYCTVLTDTERSSEGEMGRRHRSTGRNRGPHDDFQDLESEMLASPRPSPPAALRPPVRPNLIDDRRNWDPDPHRSRDAFGRSARTSFSPIASPKRVSRWRNSQSPALYQPGALLREVERFTDPRRVMICVRRKSRREVLFAIRKTGKGAHSRKRRNQWSNVKC